jgi:hypothetical protein
MGETSTMPAFRAPSAMEALFNRAFGLVIALGFGPAYIYLLEVRGRKSGPVEAFAAIADNYSVFAMLPK